MSCSESEDLSSLENENLQEKEFKAFLNNPLDFSKTLNQDYAILKFEQNYFEQEPFLTLTTRVKNADKLTQQKVLNQSLLEQRDGVSYFKFPKSDVTRFKNEMSFDIANEKVDFIDIDPIKMKVNNRLDKLSVGQSINWNSSPTERDKVLIVIKKNLNQLLEEGKTKVGEKHTMSKILVNDTGDYKLTKKDLSIFESGTPLEFILIRGDYYRTKVEKTAMNVGTISIYNSDTFIKN